MQFRTEHIVNCFAVLASEYPIKILNVYQTPLRTMRYNFSTHQAQQTIFSTRLKTTQLFNVRTLERSERIHSRINIRHCRLNENIPRGW